MKKRYFALFLSGITAVCFSLLTACNAPVKDDPPGIAATPTAVPTDSITSPETDTSAAEIPTAAPEAEERRLLTGSFLQGWLCMNWSYERWCAEFEAMKELGMDTLILQSVYDMSGDEPEYALKAAKETGMKLFIGLIADDSWWDFGWGIPKLPEGKTDPGTESYFAVWCEDNGRLNAKMIGDIWNQYGSEYREQIAGWYYWNEIWNIDAACAQTDDKAYAKCIGNNINLILDAINAACPEKPLMLSPFYNQTLSSAEQYKAFWIDIFSVADFRPGDIFAPQDCVGAKNVPLADLPDWIGCLKEAADTEAGMRFWVNNECFNSDGTPADVARFIDQIEATDPYAEAHIMFSWNHYYNPLNSGSAAPYNDALKDYLKQYKQQNKTEAD